DYPTGDAGTGGTPGLDAPLHLCCMNSLDVGEGVPVVARESQTGPAAVPAQLGERFPSGMRVRGRYRVVSEIGAGAFGTVCLGEDESTGHRVAIRFLPRNFASTPQAAQAV